MNAPLPTPEGMEPARTLAVRLWSDPPAVEDKIVAEIRARDAQWQRHLAAEREARAKAEASAAKWEADWKALRETFARVLVAYAEATGKTDLLRTVMDDVLGKGPPRG